MNSEHTPLPWREGRPGSIVCDTEIPEMRSGEKGNLDFYEGHIVAESLVPRNAKFIIRAVNNFDSLLGAAKLYHEHILVNRYEHTNSIECCETTKMIANAEGKI